MIVVNFIACLILSITVGFEISKSDPSLPWILWAAVLTACNGYYVVE